MKRFMNLYKLTFAFTLFLSIPFTANAEEQSTANIAEVWVMTPVEGMEDKFVEAFKNHLEYRQDKEDPREWNTYRPLLGKHLNKYHVRTCCVAWGDLDDYKEWANKNNVGQHWQDKVSKYVASYEHYYYELDMENSNWPDDSSKFMYFGVTEFHGKFGKDGGIEQGKKALSDNAKEMKWPYYWSWSRRIGGKGGIGLVIPYNDYKGMERPEENFYQALSKHLGSEEKAQKLFEQWDSNFKGSKYNIYVIDKEMSMQAK
ncbi:hypothetical protein FE810_16560 [Thalassotalea litorea]|uniref:Uncharacterized protein n=1 Tax=Thalassotalea litorea TaxID=2020715 RepID=A0A5R9IE59_9GAMM|nr:hypothetical protein [Thalassotalea litorea]TLU59900.1 hypothetical protein FE810_16560 [Thalassotalea litorea]